MNARVEVEDAAGNRMMKMYGNIVDVICDIIDRCLSWDEWDEILYQKVKEGKIKPDSFDLKLLKHRDKKR